MRKTIVTAFTILACSTTYALPLGNPSDATLLTDGLYCQGTCPDPCDPWVTWWEAISFRFGFYGDYVFDRHMQLNESFSDAHIQKTEIFTNAGLIVLNFYDRVDLFSTLGVTNFFIASNISAFAPTTLPAGNQIIIDTNSDFSWSVGARGTIIECGCTILGAEAQFFYTRPHISRITIAEETSVYDPSPTNAKYYEWQVGIGIAHRISIFAPYFGFKWSGARLNLDQTAVRESKGAVIATLNNLKNNSYWGYAIGASLVDCEKISLLLEGRFNDEKAVHINAQIRF